ncbi:MAG: cytochrome c oxidase subunit II [Verrucomicrobia bacterium]|nr:cytochrome c oxidase subunit II [Verrucomicrobiota bacterium]
MTNHWLGFPLFPEQASSMAGRMDALYFFLVAVSGFFAILIFVLIAVFIVKYRRRDGHMPVPSGHGHMWLELVWTVVPLALTMVMFFWGAKLFFHIYTIPPGAIDVFVVGKQWMWKFQHPEGQREINELHVPVGRPVKLTMISEDVIHDLFVPAFRVKRDVLPGRYTAMWFEATRPGKYRLYCAQYCGTEHSLMTGWVYAMDPVDYQNWLAGGAATEPMHVAGGKLFQQLGCATCHKADNTGRGPTMVGLYGSRVTLKSGEVMLADEDYIRDCITKPNARPLPNYEPIMPTFKGIISEEGLLQLIAYIKSLAVPAAQTRSETK